MADHQASLSGGRRRDGLDHLDARGDPAQEIGDTLLERRELSVGEGSVEHHPQRDGAIAVLLELELLHEVLDPLEQIAERHAVDDGAVGVAERVGDAPLHRTNPGEGAAAGAGPSLPATPRSPLA